MGMFNAQALVLEVSGRGIHCLSIDVRVGSKLRETPREARPRRFEVCQ